LVLAAACGALLGCAAARPPDGEGVSARRGDAGPPTKRLIEFGWDEPDTVFMRRHIAQMERAPFDGCVFRIGSVTPDGATGPFVWEAWGARAFTAAELGAAVADLRATEFRRFTHNFLRFNVTPGDVDWFDDFSAIVNNARLAAWVAREGGAAGILLDVEQYVAPLFTYAKQRDAAARSWEEYAAQARRRGREVMRGFQEGYPDLTVFLTFGYSVPWRELQRGARRLADAEYGLLAPFLDGMVEAAGGRTRLVDGYEPAYYHDKSLEAFAAGRRVMTEEVLPIVADPARYRRRLSAGFGLWLDVESRRRGWDGRDGSRNYYTPAGFARSLGAALDAADDYVWIYTEVPRWWSAAGAPLDLPEAYADAIRRVRRGVAR
jgi:hypothetical protein